MSLKENKSIVRRWIEAYNNLFNTREFSLLDNLFDEFIATDYFDHAHQVDREGSKQLFLMGFQGFSDWHETIEDIIAEGDKVWIRLSYTGTHTGEFMGLPPTGNKVTSKAVDIYRIVNGKLLEYWNVTDDVNILKQIGAIEVTEKGKKFFPIDNESSS